MYLLITSIKKWGRGSHIWPSPWTWWPSVADPLSASLLSSDALPESTRGKLQGSSSLPHRTWWCLVVPSGGYDDLLMRTLLSSMAGSTIHTFQKFPKWVFKIRENSFFGKWAPYPWRRWSRRGSCTPDLRKSWWVMMTMRMRSRTKVRGTFPPFS